MNITKKHRYREQTEGTNRKEGGRDEIGYRIKRYKVLHIK